MMLELILSDVWGCVMEQWLLAVLVLFVVVVSVVLWRAAKAKRYDPRVDDLSDDFDPQHDHFSPDHARFVLQGRRKSASELHPQAPVGVGETRVEGAEAVQQKQREEPPELQ